MNRLQASVCYVLIRNEPKCSFSHRFIYSEFCPSESLARTPVYREHGLTASKQLQEVEARMYVALGSNEGVHPYFGMQNPMFQIQNKFWKVQSKRSSHLSSKSAHHRSDHYV